MRSRIALFLALILTLPASAGAQTCPDGCITFGGCAIIAQGICGSGSPPPAPPAEPCTVEHLPDEVFAAPDLDALENDLGAAIGAVMIENAAKVRAFVDVADRTYLPRLTFEACLDSSGVLFGECHAAGWAEFERVYEVAPLRGAKLYASASGTADGKPSYSIRIGTSGAALVSQYIASKVLSAEMQPVIELFSGTASRTTSRSATNWWGVFDECVGGADDQCQRIATGSDLDFLRRANAAGAEPKE